MSDRWKNDYIITNNTEDDDMLTFLQDVWLGDVGTGQWDDLQLWQTYSDIVSDRQQRSEAVYLRVQGLTTLLGCLLCGSKNRHEDIHADSQADRCTTCTTQTRRLYQAGATKNLMPRTECIRAGKVKIVSHQNQCIISYPRSSPHQAHSRSQNSIRYRYFSCTF